MIIGLYKASYLIHSMMNTLYDKAYSSYFVLMKEYGSHFISINSPFSIRLVPQVVLSSSIEEGLFKNTKCETYSISFNCSAYHDRSR